MIFLKAVLHLEIAFDLLRLADMNFFGKHFCILVKEVCIRLGVRLLSMAFSSLQTQIIRNRYSSEEK